MPDLEIKWENLSSREIAWFKLVWAWLERVVVSLRPSRSEPVSWMSPRMKLSLMMLFLMSSALLPCTFLRTFYAWFLDITAAVPAAVARPATPNAVAMRMAVEMTNLRNLCTKLSGSMRSSDEVKSSSGVVVPLGTALEGMYLFPLD